MQTPVPVTKGRACRRGSASLASAHNYRAKGLSPRLQRRLTEAPKACCGSGLDLAPQSKRLGSGFGVSTSKAVPTSATARDVAPRGSLPRAGRGGRVAARSGFRRGAEREAMARAPWTRAGATRRDIRVEGGCLSRARRFRTRRVAAVPGSGAGSVVSAAQYPSSSSSLTRRPLASRCWIEFDCDIVPHVGNQSETIRSLRQDLRYAQNGVSSRRKSEDGP